MNVSHPKLASVIGCLALTLASAGTTHAASKIFPRIFVGGVSGTADLAVAANSNAFRADGGALYSHNVGWNSLSAANKDTIANLFANNGCAVEIGYEPEDPSRLIEVIQSSYLSRNMQIDFITCNAFAKQNIPTVSDWRSWVTAFRNAGIAQTTLILPTFEYANFIPNQSTLASNKVSQRSDFQDIIRFSGGIVLDTPSNYFFERVASYRAWVLDAIKWTRDNGYSVVVIMSPHSAGTSYDEESQAYVNYLRDNDALPHIYVVENYSNASPSTYINIVGNEDTPHHQLGCARRLQRTWLPNAVGRTSDFDGDGKKDSEGTGRSDFNVRDMGFEFNSDNNFEGWGNTQNISGLAVSSGKLRGTTTSADPQISHSGFAFDGGHMRNLLIRLNAGATGGVQVYWGVNGGATNEGPVSISYTAANTWQTLNLNMASNPRWKNQTITSIRIDPISVANKSFQIDWIWLDEGR